VGPTAGGADLYTGPNGGDCFASYDENPDAMVPKPAAGYENTPIPPSFRAGRKGHGMLLFDIDRVRANVRKATTEDLLDRITVYRPALEEAAVPVILEELMARGVDAAAIIAHEQARGETVHDASGAARPCARCRKPAVVREWAWHRWFGRVPVFPRQFYLCEEHRARNASEAT
jgi:hypothetical protein